MSSGKDVFSLSLAAFTIIIHVILRPFILETSFVLTDTKTQERDDDGFFILDRGEADGISSVHYTMIDRASNDQPGQNGHTRALSRKNGVVENGIAPGGRTGLVRS